MRSAVDGDPPPPGLDGAEWLVPSRRLRTLRLAQSGASTLLAVRVAVIVTRRAAATSVVLTAVPLAALAVGAVVAAGLVRRVGAWSYLERDDDLVVRRGVLVRRLSVIPYGRMQLIDVTAGPFERVFGLSTVRMHTAAAATDARIPGLDTGEAARIRERLTALGEARAAGL